MDKFIDKGVYCQEKLEKTWKKQKLSGNLCSHGKSQNLEKSGKFLKFLFSKFSIYFPGFFLVVDTLIDMLLLSFVLGDRINRMNNVCDKTL